MGHFFYALDNAWTLAKKSPFSYSINWGSFVSVGGYLDHPYSAQVEWVVLLPDNLQYRTWSNILFCYAVAMSLAEAASILQFFWDSEMNWGVRKKNTLHIWPQFLNFNARTHFYMKLVLIRFFYSWMIAIPQFRILIYSCERAFYSRQPRDFYMGA